MKKIVSILMLFAVLAFAESKAQITMFTSGSYTVTDGGTAGLSATLTQQYQTIGIQFIGTKVSGTIAGTVVLQVSLDGLNYFTIGDSYTQTDITTNTMIWELDRFDGNPYLYYKVLITGSGTMVQTCTASVWRRL